jgi:3-deoxy-D-manno-octulosonic-acid transferase
MSPRDAAWRMRAGAYATAMGALAPAAAVMIAARVWSRRKALVGLREKLSGEIAGIAPGSVLIHGVSLGEVALMKALVPRLEAAGQRVLLTTTTETGWAGLEKSFAGRARAFLPFDVPWAVARFLSRARPRLVVLLENELWPLLLCACAERGIPVVLANARMTTRSHHRLRLSGALMRPLIASLAGVLAQNATYAARLVDLGAKRARVRVCGSMKADVVMPATAADAASEAARLGIADGKPWLLLGSTSQPEEEFILRASLAWARDGWRVVICPRHPERGAALVELCARLGLPARASSTGSSAGGEQAAVVVDEIGRLGALYALCARGGGIAVVGGSLGSGRGGQNMLEAAAAGCATVVGWDTRNQPDTMQLLHDHQAVVAASDMEFGAAVAALARDPARRAALGAAGRRAWASGRGAGSRVAEALVAFCARASALPAAGRAAACAPCT